MCGRTASHLTAPALQSATRAVRFVNQQRYRPSFNIGPASNSNHPPVLVRSAVDGARELRAMRWSLIPSSAQSVAEVQITHTVFDCLSIVHIAHLVRNSDFPLFLCWFLLVSVGVFFFLFFFRSRFRNCPLSTRGWSR
jgi:hypothetical protein